MNGLVLFLATATLGVEYGWRPADGGGIEYIIQIEPEALQALQEGKAIVSELPPQVAAARRIRIQVGTGPVPRIGAAPSLAPAEPRPLGMLEEPLIRIPGTPLTPPLTFGGGGAVAAPSLEPPRWNGDLRAPAAPASAGGRETPWRSSEPAPLSPAGGSGIGAPVVDPYRRPATREPYAQPGLYAPSGPHTHPGAGEYRPPARQPATQPRGYDPRNGFSPPPEYAPPSGDRSAASGGRPYDWRDNRAAANPASPAPYGGDPSLLRGVQPAGGLGAKSGDLPGPADGGSGQSAASRKPTLDPKDAALAEKQEELWMPLVFTVLLLFASFGVNLYLGWISREFYLRYRELSIELRRATAAT